jgi:MFS family permease
LSGNEEQVTAAEDAVPQVAAEPSAPRRTWAVFIGVLMLAYFGTSVALFAPVNNVLPRMIEDSGGAAHKGAYLALVTGLGAVAAMVFNPLAGHFSDKRLARDNRSMVVAIGLVGGAVSLELLGQQRTLAGLAICWTLCQATINIAYSSMAASVIDHVPRRDWGFAWGLIAVAQAVGLIVGFAIVGLIFVGPRSGMTVLTCVFAVCLGPLVMLLRRLPRGPHLPPSGRPMLATLLGSGRGFGAVWIGKFLVQLGSSVVLLYLFYYLQDVIHYPKPSAGQVFLVVVSTLATIVATVTIGRLADRSGRYRRYAVVSTAVLAATGFVLGGISSWPLVVVCALAIGASTGAYQPVTQALSMTVLPDPSSAARDLGIINIAVSLPQVIGPPMAALVISLGGGYRGLFFFAGAIIAVAALVFSQVSG